MNDPETFDCLLSHNTRDKPAVRALARDLRGRGVSVWLDEERLRPGVPWQKLLEAGIRDSQSIAVLVGASGVGPWEAEEVRAALSLAVKDHRPVIPVLLPDAPAKPELPLFLQERGWVDLRPAADFGDLPALDRLIWGITGTRPEPSGPVVPPPAPRPERPPGPGLTVWVLVLLVTALPLAGAVLWWWDRWPGSPLGQALDQARAAMDSGRFADALADYARAGRLDAADAAVRFGLDKAAVLAKPPPDGDLEAAERDLGTWRGTHPRDPHLPLLLGLLAQNRGDAAAAEARYREALGIDPGLPHAWFGLGVLAEGRGDRTGARADYEQALKRAPGQRQYLTNLAGLLLAQGDYAGALRRYEALLQGASGLLLARLDAGNAARLAGDLAAACWHHERLLADLDAGPDADRGADRDANRAPGWGPGGPFAGPDNGAEWVFDTPGGEVSLQTAANKAAYARAAADLTRRLAAGPPCAAPADGPPLPGGDGRVRALIEADLDRLAQSRPEWRERLAALRERALP
jgi:tetratricopeptide (TPR) repeat protein